MFSTFKLKPGYLFTLAGIIALFFLIAFTEIKQEQKTCKSIVIEFTDESVKRFITKRDIKGYLTNQGTDPIVGEPYSSLDFRKLEKRLLQHGFIEKCQVSRDLFGNLIVTITEPVPVARLLTLDGRNGYVEGNYVSEAGTFFPVSMNYTARVPLLKGTYFSHRSTLKDSLSQPVLDLLIALKEDPFWRALITEVSVDEVRNVIMWPQYGSQQFELGQPTDIPMKLEKLKLFYKHVLSLKDAEGYKRVNVQYRNQIVCE
ncbi:cell division protein FtsQ/DivIB [Arsenicibacter rosenii]|uniref:Cell division protein FtsQ n=1 Tax=Arsenicibacter rosenii TaxID=1750698 RepID=A0A1S2VFJ0_9BACT|nr:hypothetical protein [Arsenicibacter rosenii]OIN57190.1 hypothetical protein BLX24_20725 [Arsenicibacter rosenii]